MDTWVHIHFSLLGDMQTCYEGVGVKPYLYSKGKDGASGPNGMGNTTNSGSDPRVRRKRNNHPGKIY